MKRTSVIKKFRWLAILLAIAITATTVYASSPYNIASFWMADPLDPGHAAPPEGTDPSSAVEGYWWRDTTNQNAIAQHSDDQFTGQVYQVYYSSKLRVLVYSSTTGPNTIALISTASFFIIGPGGSGKEANAAKMAFQAFYPGITSKTLKGIILTGATPEESWGSEFWRNSYRTNPPAPIYASAAYFEALEEREALGTAITDREDRAYGHLKRGLDDSNPPQPVAGQMAWGPDGFLGAGSMNTPHWGLVLPFYSDPTITITEETTLYVDSIPVTLILSADRQGGIIAWLPNQRVLVGADSGQYLPDAGSFRQASAPITQHIQALEQMITLYAILFTPQHGMYISGEAEITSALTAQRDALQSIYNQTLERINAGDSIDEAAAAVALPADLASSPYNQELVSTLPGIVRNIYHDKLGWFGGETSELASTLTPAAKAAALAEALGGADNLIAAARNAELNARDLAAAEKALYLAEAAYNAAPDNPGAIQVYVQALRKNAFMQKSAQVRNYYLRAVQDLIPAFTKSGDEDTAVAFTAAEFAERFHTSFGDELYKVKIVSLPAAEAGILTLPGTDGDGNAIAVPVTAGQEIPLAGLDGLVFTPAANWNGSTAFTWTGAADSGSEWFAPDGIVSITINPVNDPPAVATPTADVVVDEDALATAIDLATVFADADGDALIYAVSANSNPALVTTALDSASLTLSFAANSNGQATVNVSATDPAGASVSDEFTVSVNPVNDLPTAADATITVVADKSQTITLDYGDIETSQANLTISFGTLNGTLDTSDLPNLTYTAPSTAGDDSFTYTVTDRGDPDGCSAAPCAAAVSVTATVHVTVLAAPSASISGVIFNDANANGSLDAGEGGLPGVVVQLQDASGSELETFTTGADGAYTFTALEDGSYQVYAPKDANRVQTTQNPIAVTLAEAQAVTGVNIASVVSADLKVSMTYSVNSKKIIYAITVTNDGPADALSAALTDVLPDTVAYISVIPTQGTCSGGKTVNCNFGTIASGGSVTVMLQVNRVNTKIPVVNTATASSSVFDIEAGDNSATVPTP